MSSRRERLSATIRSHSTAKYSVTAERSRLREARDRLALCLKAQSLLQKASQTVQREAHARIAAVVTRCLETVFEGEDYSFKIRFDRKRGKTEAVSVITQGRVDLEPMTASAGAAVDVVAFALRLACLCATSPRPRMFLALDEPFKHVGESNSPRIRGLIEGLARDLKVQILLATHNSGLRAGKVVEL